MKKSLRFQYFPLILCAAATFFLYSYASTAAWNRMGDGTIYGISANLFFYAAASLIVMALYIISSAAVSLFGRNYYNFDKEDQAKPIEISLRVLNVFFLAVALFYLYKVYVSETLVYPLESMVSYIRQIVPHLPFFVFVLAGSAVTFFALESTKGTISSKTAGAVLFAAMNAIFLYCPNPVEDFGGAAIRHIHAYTNSIINVAHFVPYDEYNTSIYGHYGILYLPLVKLFGGRFTAITLAITLFGFLTFFASFRALSYVIKSDLIFFLTMAAASATTTVLNRRGQYYQVNPHRMLFPSLLLLLIMWEETSKRAENIRRSLILEWIFMSLAIVWNLETGVLCVLVLMCVKVFQCLNRHPLFSWATLKAIILTLPYLPISFSTAWALTGLYNILTGGGFNDLKTFIYPLLSSNFMIDTLHMPIMDSLGFYVFVIIVSGLCTLEFLRLRTTRVACNSTVVTLGFTISLSSLAMLVYFMNRPAFGNIEVSFMQFTFLLGMICDRIFLLPHNKKMEMLKSPQEILFIGTGFLAYFALTFIAISMMLETPEALTSRAGKVWENPTMRQIEAEMKEVVPKDTFAYGIGVPELYEDMGWDTGFYGIDFSDINRVNMRKIEKKLKDVPAVITTDTDFDATDWDLVTEWPTRVVSYHYYVRKGSHS